MPTASFAQLFTPKIVSVLRAGYGLGEFRNDLAAGVTVAIVALPLSMAIAIASGVSPERGLWTAIIGGFLVSALGGSRYQIGGPAGAFIVLVAATVMRHGVEGLVLATFLSGIVMMVAGWLRLGTFVKFIPYPVTVGFTTGIAAIIFASQIHPFLGLSLSEPEPGPIVEKLTALWHAAGTFSLPAVAIAGGTVAMMIAIRRFLPKWPDMIIAIAAMSVIGLGFDGQIATLGSEFGGIPAFIPPPALPNFDPALIRAVLPDALGFALLGSIESLLSAVVADSISNGRHRSNCELVAQGVANIGASLFGGFCVTGTIARTATNVRAGAHGPVAGILHAVSLIGFVLLAAPLAAYIPLAALAGVLAVVAWNMAERRAFATLLGGPRGDAVVLLVTFGLTVFRDLTEAILAGVLLGSMLFIRRMSLQTEVEGHTPLVARDAPDTPHDPTAQDPGIIVQRVRGALFFGAASSLDAVLDRIGSEHRMLILDLSEMPYLDASGAHAIYSLAERTRRKGVEFRIAGITPSARTQLQVLERGHHPLEFVNRPEDAFATG